MTTLPPSVVAAGDLIRVTESWAVTHDTHEQVIFPYSVRLRRKVRVVNVTHYITCHHLASGNKVVFKRGKTTWHDSRKLPVVRQRGLWSDPKSENDWKGTTALRSEVVAEIARMGGGTCAAALVRSCE